MKTKNENEINKENKDKNKIKNKEKKHAYDKWICRLKMNKNEKEIKRNAQNEN